MNATHSDMQVDENVTQEPKPSFDLSKLTKIENRSLGGSYRNKAFCQLATGNELSKASVESQGN